jgi:hypothetical protein
MGERERRRNGQLASEAREWLEEQLRWEARLDQLRRPGGGARPRRRPRPAVALRRAS